jgi:hypothetical protein
MAVGSIFTCLDLEWNCKSLLFLSVLHNNLNGSIYVSFQSVHWRPDMFLDVKKLVDAHFALKTITIFDDSIGLEYVSVNLRGN